MAGVTYDRNGATGGAVPVDATVYAGGASVTVMGNVGALSYSGYNFGGWNTAANGSGTAYSPGDVFTITVSLTLYAIWASTVSLITPTQLREHISTSLTDSALQTIIDGEEQDIVSRYGSHTSQVEEIEDDTPGSLIFPRRPVSSITSITEVWPDTSGGGSTATTLASDDYVIVPGGREIRRLNTGTHPLEYWGNRVTITYVPVVDTAKRIRALIDLCKLTISATPGLKSESVGGGEYSYTAAPDIGIEREKIYARLDSGRRGYA
jgi:hypothetical protein